MARRRRGEAVDQALVSGRPYRDTRLTLVGFISAHIRAADIRATRADSLDEAAHRRHFMKNNDLNQMVNMSHGCYSGLLVFRL